MIETEEFLLEGELVHVFLLAEVETCHISRLFLVHLRGQDSMFALEFADIALIESYSLLNLGGIITALKKEQSIVHPFALDCLT